jgi:hypothetical protein
MTLLLTGYNEKFKPLADITVPRMQDYAQRHNLRFKAQQYGESNPYWEKIRDTIAALSTGFYERVFWLDADQLITTPEVSFDRLTKGVHFSQDWGVDATEPHHFSACGFVACLDSLPLFEWVESVREQYVGGDFPEQTPLRLALQENRFPGMIHVHPRRVFNSVPIEVHPSVVEPWQPGDFAAHITMLTVEERVKLAKEIAERE